MKDIVRLIKDKIKYLIMITAMLFVTNVSAQINNIQNMSFKISFAGCKLKSKTKAIKTHNRTFLCLNTKEQLYCVFVDNKGKAYARLYNGAAIKEIKTKWGKAFYITDSVNHVSMYPKDQSAYLLSKLLLSGKKVNLTCIGAYQVLSLGVINEMLEKAMKK